MTRYLIYGLVDPMTHQLRYIGKSEQGLHRPAQHSMPSYLKRDKTHKGNWVRSLVAKGLKPGVVVIQEFSTRDRLNEAETFWISYFKFMGCPLTNHQRGGAGFTGKHTKETRARMAASHRGVALSEEHRAKISKTQKGRKFSDETRAKMSIAQRGHRNALGNKSFSGREHSTETKAKMSLAALNRKQKG